MCLGSLTIKKWNLRESNKHILKIRSSLFSSLFFLFASFNFLKTFLQQNSYFDAHLLIINHCSWNCEYACLQIILQSDVLLSVIWVSGVGMKHERYHTFVRVKELHLNNTACVTWVKSAGQCYSTNICFISIKAFLCQV